MTRRDMTWNLTPSMLEPAFVSRFDIMLEYTLNPAEGILEINPLSQLRSEDFQALTSTVDEYIVEHGALTGIIIAADPFPGWEDFGALVSHLKFVRGAQQDVSRVAVVTDNSAPTFIPKVVDHFISAEVRHFDSSQRDEAMGWLRSELAQGAAG